MDFVKKVKPVFDDNNTVTAGNAPGVNDGASCKVHGVCNEYISNMRGETDE